MPYNQRKHHTTVVGIYSNKYATNATDGGNTFVEKQQQGISIDMDFSIGCTFRLSVVDKAKAMDSLDQKNGRVFLIYYPTKTNVTNKRTIMVSKKTKAWSCC